MTREKKMGIALLTLVVGAGLLSLYAVSQSSKSVGQKEFGGWQARGVDSSVEELQKFSSEIEKNLTNSDLSESERKELLLLKASTILVPRTLNPNSENIVEATAILRSVYESEPTNESDVAVINTAVPLFLKALRNSCYLEGIHQNLPEKYKSFYDTLITEGVAPSAALLLSYRELAYAGLDPKFAADKGTVAARAYVSALYLYSFGGTDTARDVTILEKLKEDVEMYPTTKNLLLRGSALGDANAAQSYSFAFDIANTYGVENVASEMNTAIDATYDAVNTAATRIQGDPNSSAITQALNSFFYLESLHRRYPATVLDTAKVDTLIDSMITNVSVSKETEKVFPGFLIAGQDGSGKWMKVRTNFYDIVRQYPKLTVFFEAKGLVL